jgi:hypothetical protein
LWPERESKEVTASAAGFFFALSIRLYKKGLIKSEANHCHTTDNKKPPLEKGVTYSRPRPVCARF